jgi:hypothetical protein
MKDQELDKNLEYKKTTEIDRLLLLETVEYLDDLLAFKVAKATQLKKWLKENEEDLETTVQELLNTLNADVEGETDELYDDSAHLGCPSYPNCDIDPNGCSVVMGKDVEWYGHRD